MKLTAIAAATILAFAGTSAAIAAGDTQSRSSDSSGMQQSDSPRMEGRTGASGSASVSGSAQMQNDPETIRQVQQQLSQKGHDVSADGMMGPKTQAALKKFQKQEGLQATGKLDQQTLTALGIGESQSGSVGASGSTPGADRGDASMSGSGSAGGASGDTGPSSSGTGDRSGSSGGSSSDMGSGSSGASGGSTGGSGASGSGSGRY